MTRAWLAVVVLHLGAALSYAEDPSPRVVYRNSELHYTIALPAGWREIRPAIFKRMLSALPAVAEKAHVQFVAGFQHGDRDRLTLPYVLVQHNAGVADSLQQLAEAVSKQATRNATGETVKAMKGLVSDYAIEAPKVDDINRMVLFPSDLATPSLGKLKCLTVVRPGKTGMVMLQCYSAADRYAAEAPIFEQMGRQLTFDDGHNFVEKPPRSPHSTRSTFDPAPAFIFALLVIAGYGGYRLLRKLSMKSL